MPANPAINDLLTAYYALLLQQLQLSKLACMLRRDKTSCLMNGWEVSNARLLLLLGSFLQQDLMKSKISRLQSFGSASVGDGLDGIKNMARSGLRLEWGGAPSADTLLGSTRSRQHYYNGSRGARANK